jgi:hypothetical protein
MEALATADSKPLQMAREGMPFVSLISFRYAD